MPANTSNIAGTTVLSSLSLLGTLSAQTLAVGGGTSLAKISIVTRSVQTLTLLANRSQTTDVSLSGAAVGDIVWAIPPASGYSNGVTAQPYVSAADVVTLNFSNVSGATAVQAGPVTWTIGYIRF